MNALSRYLTIGLGILLGLSALANIGLTMAYLKARDGKTQAVADRDSARAAASACSDATEALRELADKRGDEARRAQAAARLAASRRETRAQQILSTPAAVPGDDCGSARVRIDHWIKGRATTP